MRRVRKGDLGEMVGEEEVGSNVLLTRKEPRGSSRQLRKDCLAASKISWQKLHWQH
jgi:hypothetical protein